MNDVRRLIREIHRRSLWQVLGIYLAASWGVLQVVDTVVDTAGLPDWLPGLALILLLVGLPVVLATAIVQEGLGRTAAVDSPAEETGPPSTYESPEAKRPSPIGSGRTEPVVVFTWRNAMLGGVCAMALWGVAATGLLLRGGGAAAGDEGVPPSIAVLPFENMASEENQYFTDGIHEDIITALTKVGGLKVISRTSVLDFADPMNRPTIPEIAAQLGVVAILEGSVRREGEDVRVTAQLIDGRDEGHLWADTYDRGVGVGVFALQASLAREIANELGATLAPGAGEQLERIPTESVEAYDLYMRVLRQARILWI